MADYDFVGIGDTVTDAFIELEDATVTCDVNKEHCTISMRFGDKIPYKDVHVVPAVGNSANAAVAAARLGLRTALVTNLGGDPQGAECIQQLNKEGISTEYITIHRDIKTNYHYVLMYEGERTILIKHEKYPYALPDIGTPKWLYLSSLGENSLEFHGELAQYLASHPDVKLAFQPGTYQMKFGKEAMAPFYKRAEVCVCNKEEAQRILGEDTSDIKELLQKMRDLGPRIMCISDGPRGAFAYDGKEMWGITMYPDPAPPISRTGAGDAFTSTFVVAIIRGHDIPTALQWGPINSMSVVQHVGAQVGLLREQELVEYLKKAPADYKPFTI